MTDVQIRTFKPTRALLGTYGTGHTLKAILLSSSYVFDEDQADVTDLAPNEIPGATRPTLTGVSLDLSGADPTLEADDVTFAGVTGTATAVGVFDDASGAPLLVVEFPPVEVDGELTVSWPSGALATIDEADTTIEEIADALAAHEADPTAHGLPDLTGGDGKLLGVTAGALVLVDPPAGTAGSWVEQSLSGTWFNAAEVLDPSLPKLALRTGAGADMVAVKGEVGITTSDLLDGLGVVGAITLVAEVGADFHPAETRDLTAAASVINGSNEFTHFQCRAQISTSGALTVFFGDFAGNGVTSFATFLDDAGAAGVLVTFTGTYSLT